MMNIDYNEHRISVPSQWSDVKLSDYEKWFGMKPENQHQYVELVAAICRIDKQILLDAPRQLFDTIDSTVSFIFDTNMPASTSVKIGSVDYHVTLSEDISLGQWVDIDAVMDSESDTKVSDILAIVCRPLGESYDTKHSDERKLLFRSLTCDKVLPLLAFFLNRKNESEAILHHYSALREQADQFVKDTKDFVANGVGTKRLPIWQRIRYTYLIRSLEKELSKCSVFCSTR